MAHRRFVCLFLAALMLFALAPGAFASSGVYFTMLNSHEPNTLQSSTMPFVRNGDVYVPQSVFGRLGISVIEEAPGTVRLAQSWNTNVYVEFDLDQGENITSDGGSLSVVPVNRFGALFFPMGTTYSATGALASFLGVNFRVIETEPAPTVRLYTLPVNAMPHSLVQEQGDEMFSLTARYNIFTGNIEGETGGSTVGDDPAPPETPPTPSEPEPVAPPVPAGPMSLSFVGLTEETDTLLDALRRSRIPAGFFVTEEDAHNHPDLIRRLHGEGHQVGIFLAADAAAEYAAASAALFEAARVRTVLVAAETQDVARDAHDLGLVVFDSNVRQIPSGDSLERFTGNLLLENNGNISALAALPGTIRNHALRVVSFVNSLF